MRTAPLFIILVSVVALFSACGDDESDSSTTPSTGESCELSSECDTGAECINNICAIPNPCGNGVIDT
ncbi:hypothetical protein KAI87_03810, partial [Myxococcota bacterium]|nr:hypothetical protein [Myxococcota bacterium]